MATKELIEQINQLPEKKWGVILGLAKGQFKMLDGWNDQIFGIEPYMPA